MKQGETNERSIEIEKPTKEALKQRETSEQSILKKGEIKKKRSSLKTGKPVSIQTERNKQTNKKKDLKQGKTKTVEVLQRRNQQRAQYNNGETWTLPLMFSVFLLSHQQQISTVPSASKQARLNNNNHC